MVNDSDANGLLGSECDGLTLARRLTNNTFSLATGKVYIDPQRARNLDADIYAFDPLIQKLRVITTTRIVQQNIT